MIEFIDSLPSVMAMGLLGTITYLYKKETGRIDDLEERTSKHLTESQVRQLLADKLDPIKEDLQEIKTAIKDLSPRR